MRFRKPAHTGGEVLMIAAEQHVIFSDSDVDVTDRPLQNLRCLVTKEAISRLFYAP